ncbi:hypothetical protein HY993_00295 [Candidatus Micrarchaeota archaeon]|nr:hypothetical protein [Candidatus Micrarchaeota archaeon]
MRKMIWLKVGGRHFHLLKLTGAFLMFAFLLKVAEAAYQIFVTVNKAIYAQARPDLVPQLFGWSINSPASFTGEDVLGVLMGPIGNFLFWLGLVTAALIIYQSGKIIVPIEEYEQNISAHHKLLISKARAAHAKHFGKKKR